MFIAYGDFTTIEEVKNAYPAAVHVEPVGGGWMVFTTAADYTTWKRQR